MRSSAHVFKEPLPPPHLHLIVSTVRETECSSTSYTYNFVALGHRAREHSLIPLVVYFALRRVYEGIFGSHYFFLTLDVYLLFYLGRDLHFIFFPFDIYLFSALLYSTNVPTMK
jgi:hypothetical protein